MGRGLDAGEPPRTYASDWVEHLLRVDTVSKVSVSGPRRRFISSELTPRYDLDQSERCRLVRMIPYAMKENVHLCLWTIANATSATFRRARLPGLPKRMPLGPWFHQFTIENRPVKNASADPSTGQSESTEPTYNSDSWYLRAA
jgi:hypothetical protein